MKRLILDFGSLSVLLAFAATPPAFAYGKVDAANTGACQSISSARATESVSCERLKTSSLIPTSNLQIPRALLLAQQNPPAEVPSPTLQMLDQQEAMITQMQTMLSQMKAMSAEIKKMVTSESQRPRRTSQTTQQNPTAEVASPSLLLFEQQQAMVIQMQAIIAQMHVMMRQVQAVALAPTRHGTNSRDNVFQQQQTMMAEMKTIMDQMKMMMETMNASSQRRLGGR